jgi:hypothetical protein
MINQLIKHASLRIENWYLRIRIFWSAWQTARLQGLPISDIPQIIRQTRRRAEWELKQNQTEEK